MEIDITSLAKLKSFPLSHSQMEGGPDAGRKSWRAAMRRARHKWPLDTIEKISALKKWCNDSGAWTEEETNKWSSKSCNAMFLQIVAGDVREAKADRLCDINWDKYESDDNNRGTFYAPLNKDGTRSYYYSLE